MLYQIRERKRIPEASLFYTQKFIFTQNLTRLKILLPSFRCACFTFSVIFFSLSLSRSVRMASEAPIKSQKSTRAYYW